MRSIIFPSAVALLCALVAAAAVPLVPFVPANAHNAVDSNDWSSSTDDPLCVRNPSDPIRLPTTSTPSNYNLFFAPNLSAASFTGTLSLSITITQQTTCLILHADELQVNNVKLFVNGGRLELIPNSISFEKQYQFLVISFASLLPVGDAVLTMNFVGTLNDKLVGFYRSSFVDSTGTVQYLAVTQMQPITARLAFPCYDEPALKATFRIAIESERSLVTLSNMPEESATETDRETIIHQFETSLKMSTYLVAMIVGPLDVIEAKAPNNVVIRTYAVPGKVELSRFSLDMAVASLIWFEEYFQYPYPMTKIDMVAVPDFSFGGMENWGLIIYRETAMLFDPVSGSFTEKKRVAEVVCHEISHQWFGNLVTMEWWDGLWLNEGFATYMAYLSVNSLIPEWKMEQEIFLIDNSQVVLELDALTTSHPIIVDIKDPATINEIFDKITYNKGAAVIRMLANFIDAIVPNAFQNSLRAYMRKYKYANTVTDDLWSVIQETTGLPIASWMRTWTYETGYPVVTLHETRPGVFDVSQNIYLSFKNPDVNDLVWFIPLTVSTSSNQVPLTYQIETKTATINVPQATWVKANFEQRGFYRVNYDQNNWSNLLAAIGIYPSVLSTAERYSLLDDIFSLGRAGLQDITTALDFIPAISKDTDYLPWAAASKQLLSLQLILQYESVLGDYNEFVCHNLQDAINLVGWDVQAGETVQFSELRTVILTTAVACEDLGTIQEALRRWDLYQNDPNAVSPSLRNLVYNTFVSQGGKAEWEIMLARYYAAPSAQERERCLRALSSTTLPYLLQKIMELGLSPADVKSQDTVLVMETVAANKYGLQLAWTFFRENYAEFNRRYGSGLLLGRLVTGLTKPMTGSFRYLEVEEFFEANPAPAAANAIKQYLVLRK
eukprot:TRINITY_DN1406_c0_g1_i3.p1 TRINITY_DN1406_c0_g1~~TRINITY_DN1406_c0_g1_i3.p1  ORF type:complete len:895 (+),score=173.41 TRINITY_DN1406_c0_g1_i3:54-2738(+)